MLPAVCLQRESRDQFEITEGLVDIGDIGKGVGEGAEDVLELDHLMTVHHADQEVVGGLGKHALRLDQGDPVAQLLQQLKKLNLMLF